MAQISTEERIDKALTNNGRLHPAHYRNWARSTRRRLGYPGSALEKQLLRLAEVIEEIREGDKWRETTPTWVSTEERKPDQMESVLVSYSATSFLGEPVQYVTMAYRFHEEWQRDGDGTLVCNVTHWMPLPELLEEISDA